MSLNHRDPPLDEVGQSPGCDPRTTKRNSGLFAFLKWFKPSTSRESIDADLQNSQSSSCDSLNSTQSNGTVASFSYVPPSAYKVPENKCLVVEPETDTYRDRLKQRDKRRESDKNLTLRKKYNLFFNRDTLLRSTKSQEESTKSLPLMTRIAMEEEEKTHRRTNSESSKTRKAGAYLHVKGKRKAPQPPGLKQLNDAGSTMSLKRKKRLAPAPPAGISADKIITTLTVSQDIIFNDSLKLDHGILKPTKDIDVPKTPPADQQLPDTSARSSYVEAPVSPRPWYKRNSSRLDANANKKEKETKSDHKYEPIERLPEVQYMRNSIIDLTLEDASVKNDNNNKKKMDEKRKSGMSFLTNISELDREACEIVRKEHQKNGTDITEIPQFMRPREETKINTDSWVSPKRRSARDLIAKFNAITNVTKVTVNTAFFGVSSQKETTKKDYFGKRSSLNEDSGTKKQENLLQSHKKRIEQIDRKLNSANPLMKSESASAIKVTKPETPKSERKSWNCPKCFVENEYWRIICHVCSAIKPYFDDMGGSVTPANKNRVGKDISKTDDAPASSLDKNVKRLSPDKVLERSKTQIGFSALASYNLNRNKKVEKSASADDKTQIQNKNEEREKLKKMLIEMKNSLPKRKSNILMKQNSRASVIVEIPDDIADKPEDVKEKTQEEKVVEIIIGTKETIYENIKVKKTDNPKPIKVSSSAQTTPAVKKSQDFQFQIAKKTAEPPKLHEPKNPEPLHVKKIENKPTTVIAPAQTSAEADPKKTNFELMRPKDFENIYADPNAQSPARIYANLARNEELAVFFNMPKRFSEIKNNLSKVDKNTDTIEINRLLRRLESAIAKGELTEASMYAKELAQLKINCSVIRQKPPGQVGTKKQGFNIEMYVEDKISHRGPFQVEVTENQTVAELKLQVEQEFEIPANVQRWILGKELASDDSATLKTHNITEEGCPVFLYLVAPDAKNSALVRKAKKQDVPSTSKLLTTADSASNTITDTAKPDNSEQAIEHAKAEDSTETEHRIPKIVKVIPKVVEVAPVKMETAGPLPEPAVAPVLRSTTVVEVTALQIDPPKQNEPKGATPKRILQHQKAVLEEDFDDYDTKTLRPQAQEWECHLCTLLNPITSNVCAVCATVRQKESALVQPKKSTKKRAPQPKPNEARSDQTYLQLVNLDNADLVENVDQFECLVCFLEIKPGEGVTLRECLHQFCKNCLAQTVEYTEDAEVKCPYRDDDYSCNIALQDREIKALVTAQVYDQYLAKSVTEAENKIGKSFHCKTPDCRGWCIFEDNVNEFRCPVCRRINCLTCQAIHAGLNCKQYQEKMTQESEVDEDAKRTKEMVEEMVRKGEALTCPTCQVILMKKWGCDWVRCSMCKTEICWVTRGPRWGPGGKGDTTGGCQCGINGVKCHPQCSYCH